MTKKSKVLANNTDILSEMINISPPSENFVWISFQLTEEERRQFGVVAATFGISRSELVRQAVRFYSQILLARMQKTKNTVPPIPVGDYNENRK